MDIIAVYKCLCDRQRLRILNLLQDGPLCVCHLMEILQMEQVKVSKHLLFMKKRGLVVAERCAQWMIYRINEEANPLLQENLKCLQDCAAEELCFREDLSQRRKLMKRLEKEGSDCKQAAILCDC
jgi:ArsR family transcriptional regulator